MNWLTITYFVIAFLVWAALVGLTNENEFRAKLLFGWTIGLLWPVILVALLMFIAKEIWKKRRRKLA